MTAPFTTASPPSLARRVVGLIVLIALVARTSVLVAQFSSLAHDPDSYRQLAENLVARGTFGLREQPTAYRPPLWPLLLVPCVLGGAGVELRIALLQITLGLATIGLTWHLGRRWEVGRVDWLAPLLVAIDPILLRQSTFVMTETLATLLAVLSLVALTWYARQPSLRRAIVAGFCLGLACLCRPTFLPWLAMMPLLAFFGATDRRSLAFQHGIGILVSGAVVLLPWTVRNTAVFGKPIIGTTHGGYTLLLGNNPSFYEYARRGTWGEPWDATSFQARLALDLATSSAPSDEVARDQLMYDQAYRHMEDAPPDFLRTAILRLGYLFSLFPHRLDATQSAAHATLRLTIGAFYLAEFALALLGIIHLRGRLFRVPWLWGFALLASFAVVHLFYWTDMRMRAPLVPVIALLAARGASVLARPKVVAQPT